MEGNKNMYKHGFLFFVCNQGQQAKHTTPKRNPVKSLTHYGTPSQTHSKTHTQQTNNTPKNRGEGFHERDIPSLGTLGLGPDGWKTNILGVVAAAAAVIVAPPLVGV